MIHATERPTTLSLSAIVVGALIGLLIDLGFTLLGSGIGLGGAGMDMVGFVGPGALIGIGAYTAFAMVLAFSAAGYVSARLSPATRVWDSALHGLATFALSALTMVFLIGSSAALGVGGILTRLGLGPVTVSFVALGLLVLGALSSCWGGVMGMRAAFKAARSRGDPVVRIGDRAA